MYVQNVHRVWWWSFANGIDKRPASGYNLFKLAHRTKQSLDLFRVDFTGTTSTSPSPYPRTRAHKQYRIPHLPSLAKEPCYYCSKHLKFPDGRPDYSGFLPPPKVVRRGSKRKLSMSITAGEESAMSDGEVMGGDGGRWVCWHGSCRE
jgi:hypothetical protein